MKKSKFFGKLKNKVSLPRWLIIIWVLISILLVLYFVLHLTSQEFVFYTFTGNSGNFSVAGSATFTSEYHSFQISNVDYSFKDIQVKEVTISVIAQFDDQEELLQAKTTSSDELFSLQEYLKNFRTTIEEHTFGKTTFTSKMIKDFSQVIVVRIEFIDQNDQDIQVTIPLESQSFR